MRKDIDAGMHLGDIKNIERKNDERGEGDRSQCRVQPNREVPDAHEHARVTRKRLVGPTSWSSRALRSASTHAGAGWRSSRKPSRERRVPTLDPYPGANERRSELRGYLLISRNSKL